MNFYVFILKEDKMRYLLIILIMLFGSVAYSCNYSSITLVNSVSLGGSQYQFDVIVCAGSGRGGGGDNTGNFQLTVDGGATLLYGTPSVISPTTGGIYNGIVSGNLIEYTNTTQWFTIVCPVGSCGQPQSACVSITIITDGYPNQIAVDGLEGADSYILDCLELIELPHLPILLNEFYSQVDGCKVHLFWETEMELDNAYYEVHKSYDGYKYNTIAVISGNETTFTKTEYHYIDTESVSAYYRLMQVDYDGSNWFSDIIYVKTNDCLSGFIYPNPTLDLFYLNYETEMGGLLEMRFITANGVSIKGFERVVLSGANIFAVSVRELSSGIYYLEVKNGSSKQYHKFIVI